MTLCGDNYHGNVVHAFETAPAFASQFSSLVGETTVLAHSLGNIAYGGTTSAKRQIMNQADYFYFSGHGNHNTGTIQNGFSPQMAAQYWCHDLDCVIIAGCAVLDINDYTGNYAGTTEHTSSPGKLWANVKHQTSYLGYAYTAPLDTQGAARIVSSWVANRSRMGDVAAWMNANDNRNGRNACTIQHIDALHVRYSYFKREKGFLYNSYLLTNTIERVEQ